jgi:general secretion pathway protein C
MPARLQTVALATVSAAVGFAAGLAALPRERPPAAPRPCPLPKPCPTAITAPAPALTAAPTAPKPPPSPPRAATSRPTTSPTEAAPPVGSKASFSPLSAFRFLGLGPSGGLRLARVRPGTLPAALGLESGDELIAINDFRLSDPEQALTAYARLRYADRLQLVLKRRGHQTAIVYFVR